MTHVPFILPGVRARRAELVFRFIMLYTGPGKGDTTLYSA
jgi:hypothetical protein